MMKVASLPQVTGAHILKGDDEASGIKTAESKDRKDIEQPARWVILVEACSVEAFAGARALLNDHPALRAAKRWSVSSRIYPAEDSLGGRLTAAYKGALDVKIF